MHGRKPVNAAAFAIHSQIHAARPDVIAAAHAHSVHGKAFSTLGRAARSAHAGRRVFFEDHALSTTTAASSWIPRRRARDRGHARRPTRRSSTATTG